MLVPLPTPTQILPLILVLVATAPAQGDPPTTASPERAAVRVSSEQNSPRGVSISTVSGRNAVFVSSDLDEVPLADAVLAEATIGPGKPHRVLMVTTNYQNYPSAGTYQFMFRVDANDVHLWPWAPAAANCGSGPCHLAATFWLDLDEAESASPGTFIGQPIKLKLIGGATTGPIDPTYSDSSDIMVTMTARLEKK